MLPLTFPAYVRGAAIGKCYCRPTISSFRCCSFSFPSAHLKSSTRPFRGGRKNQYSGNWNCRKCSGNTTSKYIQEYNSELPVDGCRVHLVGSVCGTFPVQLINSLSQHQPGHRSIDIHDYLSNRWTTTRLFSNLSLDRHEQDNVPVVSEVRLPAIQPQDWAR